MAVHGPTQLPAFFSNDADFRAWVAGVRAALLAAGLVRTADAGQINPVTVLRPAVGVVAGYDIFRLNDAAQATCPVFIKVEYTSFTAVDRPSLWITFGQGSDGAGNITGTATVRNLIAPFSSKAAGVTLPIYASGDGSGVFVVLNLDQANSNFYMGFMVDRPRDANGAPTTEGFQTLVFGGASNVNFWRLIPDAGPAPGAHNGSQAVSPAVAGAETKAGVEVAMSPFFVFVNGKTRVGKMFLSYQTADIAELVPFTVTEFLGAQRTYLPLGDGMGLSGPWAPTTNTCPAMLWE